ncbi:hypothetical protein D3C76_1173940 [compost metagenome]
MHCSSDGVFTRSFLHMSSHRARKAFCWMKPWPAKCGSTAISMFSSTDRHGNRPLSLRSSVNRAKPFSMAMCGSVMRTTSPSRRISPPSLGVMPKIASATLVRPEPINPAMPRISPACRSKDTSLKMPSSLRSRTDSNRSPIGVSRSGNNWFSSRPTIIEIRLSPSMLSARCRPM